MDNELPGMGMLVRVTPDDALVARPAVGVVKSGRDIVGAEASGRAAVAEGDGEAEVEAEAEAVGAVRLVDAAAGEGLASELDRNFLLERSNERLDCQERL